MKAHQVNNGVDLDWTLWKVEQVYLQTPTDLMGTGYGSASTLSKTKTPHLDLYVMESGAVVVRGFNNTTKEPLSFIIPAANVKVAGPIETVSDKK